jgi:hypothetical protein
MYLPSLPPFHPMDPINEIKITNNSPLLNCFNNILFHFHDFTVDFANISCYCTSLAGKYFYTFKCLTENLKILLFFQ